MEPMPGHAEPTLTDASNISASSDRPSHKYGDKAKMIVRRREKGMTIEGLDQPDQEPWQSRLLLDPKLTTEDKAKVEVNLVNPLNMEASDSSNKDKQPVPKLLACSFCEREFSTPHALGGHQNAHKQERAMAKRRQELAMLGVLRHLPRPFYPFSASYSDPLGHGSAFNRPSPLGVRMNSMKHTSPSLPWSSSSSPAGYWFGDRCFDAPGWPPAASLAMMNPRSSNDRLRMMERPNPSRQNGATLGSTRLSAPVLVANRVQNDEEMNRWPRLESSEVNDGPTVDLDLKL